MTEANEGLNEINRQRAALGQRVRLPIWYLVLYGAGVTSILAAQPIAMLFDAGLAIPPMQLFGILVAASPAYLVPRITGLRLPLKTSAVYPSVLRTAWVLVAAMAVGTVGTLSLSLYQLYVPALLVALLGGVGAAFAIRLMYRGISADIGAGRARR